MERRMGAPRRWERSLAWRRSCIQSWRPKPGLRDFLVRGWRAGPKTGTNERKEPVSVHHTQAKRF
eukprot:scaffold25168_cov158-Skeletonema_marinoi.AAC.1